ncbi:MAG: HlyD family secretion protein [Candidatus Gastranaerophilales bacterium]|nr:HlyD family secretion protein [Candidatus Gastranaerophilales bacterium]
MLKEKLTEENKSKIKKYAPIIVVILAIIVGGYFLWDASHYQSTDDAYIESHLVQIAPRVAGQIEEIKIDDNQSIKEGDVIAIIDPADYKIKFNQADAQYQKALLNQNVAKANLSAANSEIELAKKDLERYRNLYEKGAVSKQTFDAAQTKFDSIQAKQTSADNMIFSKNESKVADADLKTLKAQRDQAELNLSYTKIIAPRDGVVTNKNVEKGAYVQVGQPLFALASKEVWVVANFKENQVGKMKPGQNVDIKIDAYPHKTFKGKIDSIQRASGAKASLFPPENAVGSFVKIVQRIPVKIIFTEEINPDEYTIVSGMSVIPRVKVK